MSASGGYGKPRVCAGIVGHADLTLGARVREVLEAMIGPAAAASAASASSRPAHPDQGHGAPRPSGRRAGCATARYAKASPSWRRSASPSTPGMYHHAARRPARPRPRLSRHADRAEPCRRPARARPLHGQARRGVRRLEQEHPGARGCPNVHVKLGGLGMRLFGFDLHEGEVPPTSEQLAAAVAALHRDLHRSLRRRPRHVRKQLPRRQGLLRLRRVLERLQAARWGCERRREEEPVQRHASKVYRLGL